MSKSKRKTAIIIMFILIWVFTTAVNGFCWTSTELFVLEYGPGSNQILITNETVNHPDVIADTSDYWIEPALGPRDVFVDIEENFILWDDQQSQLKGFTNTGQLLFDFSIDSPDYNPEIFKDYAQNIYIDPEQNMYIQSDPSILYIPVVNYQGEIIKKIRPFPHDPNVAIELMRWSPSGSLFIWAHGRSNMTYKNGNLEYGGSPAFRANNGSYFHVKKKTPKSLEFRKFKNPNLEGRAESREITEVKVDVDSLVSAWTMIGGDGNTLYIMMSINSDLNDEIWQFDLEYNSIHKLIPINEQSYQVGLWISPFVRSDGNIYEFLFREDGLHVIRWSKE